MSDDRFLEALKIARDEDTTGHLANIDRQTQTPIFKLIPDEKLPILFMPGNSVSHEYYSKLGISRIVPNPAFQQALVDQDKSLQPIRLWNSYSWSDYCLETQIGQSLGSVKVLALRDPQKDALLKPYAMAIGLNEFMADALRNNPPSSPPEYDRLFKKLAEDFDSGAIGPERKEQRSFAIPKTVKIQTAAYTGFLLMAGAGAGGWLVRPYLDTHETPAAETTPFSSIAPVPSRGPFSPATNQQKVAVVHMLDPKQDPRNSFYRFNRPGEFAMQLGDDVAIYHNGDAQVYKNAALWTISVIENSVSNEGAKTELDRILKMLDVPSTRLLEELTTWREDGEPALLDPSQARFFVDNAARDLMFRNLLSPPGSSGKGLDRSIGNKSR